MRRLLLFFVVSAFVLPAFSQFSLYLESRVPVQSREVTTAVFSPNGRFLAAGTQEGDIIIWDNSAGRQFRVLKGHKGAILSLLFNSSTDILISGGSDKTVCVWDLYTGSLNRSLKEYRGEIRSLSLSPDDRILAAAGARNEIVLWEFPAGKLKSRLEGHKGDIKAIGIHRNGMQLLSVGSDRRMITWNIQTFEPVRTVTIESRTMQGSGLDVLSGAFSADMAFCGLGIQERILAKGGQRMIFKYNLAFYDWQTGAEIQILDGNRKDINFFVISPDKKYVITDNSTLQTGQLAFWNIRNNLIEQRYPVEGSISAIAASVSGEWIAAAYSNERDRRQSHINIWKVSGIDGYKAFSDTPVRTEQASGFGAAMKLTTSEEPLIQHGERRRIAVMTFDHPGTTDEIARTASYLLEGRLGNSPFVELVERSRISQILDELKLQQTGLTASGAAEAGRLLNAEYVLIGSINKLGQLLIITAKLVHVETGQIIGTREVQCQNAVIENISEMIALLAPSIARY